MAVEMFSTLVLKETYLSITRPHIPLWAYDMISTLFVYLVVEIYFWNDYLSLDSRNPPYRNIRYSSCGDPHIKQYYLICSFVCGAGRINPFYDT